MPRAFSQLLGAAAAVLVGGGASAAEYVPARFRPTLACMTRALRDEHRVRNVRSGVSSDLVRGGPPETLLYVAYDTDGLYGGWNTVWFTSPITSGNRSFGTMLPGIFIPPRKLDDWNTKRVGAVWRRKCGVQISVLFN
jgi:hypothetical protein